MRPLPREPRLSPSATRKLIADLEFNLLSARPRNRMYLELRIKRLAKRLAPSNP